MGDYLSQAAARRALGQFYRRTLVDDVAPFWLRHGLDRQHGGILTALDRDGTLIDSDKSIWFQGRAAWTYATLYNTIEPRGEWLDAATSCIDFLQRHGFAANGKLYFTVSREGLPLRMRRYVYSEAFAAIGCAALAKARGDSALAARAVETFAAYLDYSFTPGRMAPKAEPAARPMQGIAPLMMTMATAQEVRANLGDVVVAGRSSTQWIDWAVDAIERHFVCCKHKAVLEVVGPEGEIIDHADGRTLNPGHAIECAWFILEESRLRGDKRLTALGCQMLDWMWQRGWDAPYGGLLYFCDLFDRPVQEYWHDMKFWWPHCEAIIATALAYLLTGEPRYAAWHAAVHDWSFQHFADAQFGEWYGYLHRDGRLSSPAKGTLWKGPFHLPRMLWYLSERLA